MDLSFSRFRHDPAVIALPADLAVLLVGIAARQAASPTAMIQTRLARVRVAASRFAPAGGAFNRAVAATITSWRDT